MNFESILVNVITSQDFNNQSIMEEDIALIARSVSIIITHDLIPHWLYCHAISIQVMPEMLADTGISFTISSMNGMYIYCVQYSMVSIIV